MVCFRCSTLNPEVSRFCHHCGAVLIADGNRADHYAANPSESVRALALVSTLMPHASAQRHHVYRLGIAIAVGAALGTAAFGLLPVALVCAGVALPLMLLTYFHDHEVWSDEPLLAIIVCVVLAAGLGVGLGFIAVAFQGKNLITGLEHALPSTSTLLEECLLLPIIALILLLIAPTVMTSRPKFRHALDALTFSALAGVALALAESIVVQRGSFSSLTVHSTNAASDAFISLTLGFVKPIIYATASGLVVMRLRRGVKPLAGGILWAFLLLGAYDASVATLTTYGQRGTVLIFLIGAVLAGIGLLFVRDDVHKALLTEAENAAQIGEPGGYGGLCANCELPLLQGALFCLACGTAVAAMPKQNQHTLPSAVEMPA
jgi:hypothetical protein